MGSGYHSETYPEIPDGIRGEKLKAHIQQMIDKYAVKHKGLIDFYDYDPERLPETRKLIYEVGRETALRINKTTL